MTIQEINTFLTSSELSNFLFPLKVVFILLSLIMIFLIVYYLYKQNLLLGETKRKFMNFFSSQEFSVQKDLLGQWKEIKALIPKEDQISYKLIINKATNLFYDVLENSNLSNKSLDDLDGRHIPNIEIIKEIVDLSIKAKEDPSNDVDIAKIKQLMSSFEETLQKLHLF
ncbi:MAG: hypothetical protein PHI45_00780 [Candidatus Pacebacteria bacterium]|nr:hypothetical protein [Candidatus Paceibacterota bacterium]MDD5012983.1 hypothetical protein [Candidatus Paceibacterota bacterium]MDD5752611.1 hypothetical protein [Candidatus Paceibacterota bacterium]